jgi:hypothetical protein
MTKFLFFIVRRKVNYCNRNKLFLSENTFEMICSLNESGDRRDGHFGKRIETGISRARPPLWRVVGGEVWFLFLNTNLFLFILGS